MGLQFGETEAGETYTDRPAAFGVAEQDGLIALVHVVTPDGDWFDLPGGAIDPGEDAAEALVREFGEETGLVVRPGREIVRASQRFRMSDGRPVNNRLTVFESLADALEPALKIEDDHTLVWRDPAEALEILRHDAHAWAVAAWLRLNWRR